MVPNAFSSTFPLIPSPPPPDPGLSYLSPTRICLPTCACQDRIERHGDWKEVIGENLDFGNKEALDIVLSLLVDDNVASRGHRKVSEGGPREERWPVEWVERV